VPLWKQPETIATAKDVGRNVLIAGLVLFLVLGCCVHCWPSSPRCGCLRLLSPGDDVTATVQRQVGYANNLDAAKQLARNEPKLVANVVKEW